MCTNCEDCGDLTLPTGSDGVGISGVAITNGDLIISYTDGSTENAGSFQDPWVAVTNADLIVRTFTGSDGCTLVGTLAADATIELAYNVISPNTAIIKGHLVLDINIDSTDPSFDNGQFTITLTFPAITSGTFFSGNKVFTSPFTGALGWQDTPVHVNTGPTAGAGPYFDNGAGRVSFGNTGGTNRLIITCWPNLPNENTNGQYDLALGFSGIQQIA